MSYIRMGHPLRFVKGASEDYVYSDGTQIQDYGEISDNGFIELLFRYWHTEDERFKNHFLKRLAARLGVELRKKELKGEVYSKESARLMNKFFKEHPSIKELAEKNMFKGKKDGNRHK